MYRGVQELRRVQAVEREADRLGACVVSRRFRRCERGEGASGSAALDTLGSQRSPQPRKGAFEVRVEGVAAPIVSLLALPRPFTKLRELDLTSVAEEVVGHL